MLNLLPIPIRRRKAVLLVLDAITVFLSLPVAVLIRNAGRPVELAPLTPGNIPAILVEFFRYYTGATTVTIGVCLLVFFIFDLYDLDHTPSGIRDLLYITFVCAIALLAISTVFYIVPHWRVGRGILLIQIGLAAGGVFLIRVISARRRGAMTGRRRVLIFGGGHATRVLHQELALNFASEYEVLGLVEDPEHVLDELGGRLPLLGPRREVGRVARQTRTELLVFSIPQIEGVVEPDVMREILSLKTSGTEVFEMPTLFKMITGRVPVEVIEDSWLIFNQGFVTSQGGPGERARRVLDLIIAGLALVATLPAALLIALLIKATSPGPILYRQERLGLNRRPYEMFKFRTMVVDAEEAEGPTWSSGKRDLRVTPLGRILRRTRLDEIPNFLNVLLGDMSVVGPRPEREHFVQELERTIPYYGLRFAVRPGLTGWAQVNYSYGASVEDAHRKLEYELYYIQERSLFLDIVILLKTAQTVLLRPGS